MKIRKKITTLGCLLLLGLSGLCSCGSPSSDSVGTKSGFVGSCLEAGEDVFAKSEQGQAESTGKSGSESGSQNVGESSTELRYESSMELRYAEHFSVDYYEGGYKMLTVKDGTRVLTVPEGMEIPQVPDDVIVLREPVRDLYLVASAAMDMFGKLDAIDTIRLSGQEEDGWYLEEAKEAMRRGDILYAGKYNKPDYELIVSEGCSLALENVMITHSPEVVEMLGNFGIPVLIDYSSYESHPLGRVEWIRFYGALLDKEEEAEREFARQTAVVDSVTSDEKTGKTVAFFYLTSNGLVQVRQSSDYIPKMIELAGGRYIFENLGDPDSARSTVSMQIEEFYDGAKDADYIIYNSSIDGGVASVEELIAKCPVLKDFRAVQEGNVWCTTNDMYQKSLSIGDLIGDIHNMLLEKEDADMAYLFRLE